MCFKCQYQTFLWVVFLKKAKVLLVFLKEFCSNQSQAVFDSMQFRGASCLEGCMLVSDFGSLEAISSPLSRFLESILTVKHWDDKALQHVCCLAVLGQMQLDSKPFYNTKSVLVKERPLPLFMYKLNIFPLMSQGSGT